jgi:ATP-binding cassette subfamily B multidrug efflux pump
MPKNDVSDRKPGLLARLTARKDDHKQAREQKVEDLLPREDELLGKAYDSRLLRRLMAFTRPYKSQLVFALILMMITSLLSAAGPYLIGHAVDKGIRASEMGDLRFWTLLFIVASTIEWLANRTRIVLMAWVGTRVVADLRSHLFRHLHSLSLSFYSNYSIGRLMSRLISDVGAIQDFMTWSITGFVRAIFLLIGIVGFMLAMNLPLALLTFTVLPLMFLLTTKWRAGARLVNGSRLSTAI